MEFPACRSVTGIKASLVLLRAAVKHPPNKTGIAAGLLLYGNLIGTLLDGGALAGHLIRLLAPVVPFIYLEIVLEALLKGMGQQSFSSLNYLAEYTIRIAIVLVCMTYDELIRVIDCAVSKGLLESRE